jgi:transposase-like protein
MTCPLKRHHFQRENLWVVQTKGGHEMPRGKKLTAEQIIGKLREAEVELARGKTVPEVVRKIGVTEQTYYRWKREYVGLRTDQAKRLKDLEQENARLDRLPRLLGRAGKVRCRQPEHVNDSMAAWESYANAGTKDRLMQAAIRHAFG